MSASSPQPDSPRLESWDQIAFHLGITKRQAQRWEHELGLPIHREGRRKRAAVFAFTGELDAWRGRLSSPPNFLTNQIPPVDQEARVADESNGVEAEPGTGSDLASQRKPHSRRDRPDGRRLSFLLKFGVPSALVMVGALTVLWLTLSRPGSRSSAIELIGAYSPARLLSGATSEGGSPLSRQITFIPGALLVTPDGRRIYAIEANGKNVLVLSAVDLTVETSLTLPSSALRAIMSPDGKRIYIGSMVDGIMIVHADTNRAEDLGIRTGGPVMDLDVSSDGRKAYLAMGDKGLKEVDLRSREVRSISEDISPQYLGIDPTGRQLFVSYQGGGPGGSKGHDALVVYDLTADYEPHRLPRLPRVGGPIAFSPFFSRALLDGWDACSNPSYDHKGCPAVPSHVLHILSTSDLNVVQTLAVPVAAKPVGFSPDGRKFVFVGEAIIVYDISRQKILERFSSRGESYLLASFAPQGDRLFVSTERAEILMFRSSKCPRVEDGLANLYSGDGTLDDVAGTGSVHPRGNVDFAPGVLGQAFHFNSGFLEIDWTNACVYCGDEWSISLFAKLASLQSEATILKRERTERFGYRLFKSRANRMVFEVDRGAQKTSSITGAEDVINGKWYRIEMTSDGRSIEMFLNGVSAGRIALPVPDPFKHGWGRVFVGGTPEGTALDGWIDEIAFYNRELSVKEIQSRPAGSHCVTDATNRGVN